MKPAAAEFGPSTAVLLMPGATLVGYAVGVGLSASIARDLTAPRGLALHLLFLAASLCLAAWAWTPLLEVTACLLIGLGCSLTQRLLAAATSAVPNSRRAQAIGWIIAAGLCGIVVARLGFPAAATLGRRPLLLTDACLIALSGCACLRGIDWSAMTSTNARTERPEPVWSLWRRLRALRRAALQQAAVFAAYNLGWALYPPVAAAQGPDIAAIAMGIVASLGAVAALVSGRLCARRDPADIANSGFIAILISGGLAVVAGRLPHSWEAEMALLDIGTQVALVANQARAQSSVTTPAARGRVAAIVTTLGFIGGAGGAAVGNLWR